MDEGGRGEPTRISIAGLVFVCFAGTEKGDHGQDQAMYSS